MTTVQLPAAGRSKAEKSAQAVLDEHLHPVGLRMLDPDLPFAEYEHIGRILGGLRDMTSWALGDWILFGEATYGERYAQAVEATGRAKPTLVDYARVSAAIARSRRRRKLTFAHHRLVARRGYEPADQDRWLDEAEEKGWSVEEMRGAMTAINPGDEFRDGPEYTGPPVDKDRTVAIAKLIVRQATPLGDGREAVSSELMAQLRSAVGLET